MPDTLSAIILGNRVTLRTYNPERDTLGASLHTFTVSAKDGPARDKALLWCRSHGYLLRWFGQVLA